MGKKKAGASLGPGTRIRVKSGVAVPEFPDIPCEGWTGQILEATGKKTSPKYVIEWDDEVVEKMPRDYVEECEKNNFFYRMACFEGDQIEPENGTAEN